MNHTSRLFFLFSGMIISSHGAIIVTGVSDGASHSTYDTNASASDLVDASEGTLGSVTTSTANFGATGLNDGVAASDSTNAAFYSNTNLSATITFTLDTSVNTFGYDLASIQSIAGWGGNSTTHANQSYNVMVSYVGDASFSLLQSVSYTPFTSGNASKSSMVTISDDGGDLLASGVDEIRFVYNETGTWGTAAGLVIREIDVTGAASIPEPSSAALLGLAGLTLAMRRRKGA